MKTVWSIFKDLVNSKPILLIITRKEILETIEGTFRNHRVPYDVNHFKPHYSPTTLDTLRNQAEKVGYLGKVYKHGIPAEAILGSYVVLKHFPEGLSCQGLRREYDKRNGSFRNKENLPFCEDFHEDIEEK